LRRQTIDVYQIHNPPPEVWQQDEVYRLLDQFKARGEIRARGQSISTMDEGIHLIENRKVDVIQVLFNILNQEPARVLLPAAEKHGIGIIVRVPLASGLLTGKYASGHRFSAEDNRSNYLSPKRLKEALTKVERFKEITRDCGLTLPQIALAFILRHSGVSVAIAGAKSPAQAESNASASDAILNDELAEQIRKEFSDYNFFLRYSVRV
jgi:aryl-alcohol dehydrogenase-like predicted oxidoreductase